MKSTVLGLRRKWKERVIFCPEAWTVVRQQTQWLAERLPSRTEYQEPCGGQQRGQILDLTVGIRNDLKAKVHWRQSMIELLLLSRRGCGGRAIWDKQLAETYGKWIGLVRPGLVSGSGLVWQQLVERIQEESNKHSPCGDREAWELRGHEQNVVRVPLSSGWTLPSGCGYCYRGSGKRPHTPAPTFMATPASHTSRGPFSLSPTYQPTFLQKSHVWI